MELKCTIIVVCGYGTIVLIVPLWNWNHISRTAEYKTACSNCTFMELKFTTCE